MLTWTQVGMGSAAPPTGTFVMAAREARREGVSRMGRSFRVLGIALLALGVSACGLSSPQLLDGSLDR
jgi:hypothetical protein